MDRFDKNHIFYQEACNMARHQESLLFQRLNYFLISIAFLVASFVELALNSSFRSVPLTLLVGTTGVLLSWVYTALNFHNAKILQMVYEHATDLEKWFLDDEDFDRRYLPEHFLLTQVLNSPEFKTDRKFFLWGCIEGSVAHSFCPPGKDGKNEHSLPAPHTWMIPYFFIIFWLLLIMVYTIFFLTPIWGVVIPAVLLLYFLRPLFYHYVFKKFLG